MLYYPDISEPYMIEAEEPKHISAAIQKIIRDVQRKYECGCCQGVTLAELRKQIRDIHIYR